MTDNKVSLSSGFKAFLVASWIQIIYALASLFYIVLNGSTIFVTGLQAIFGRVPLLGGLFYSYLQSAGYVDFSALYRQAAMPALLLSVVLYVLYTLILQRILVHFLKTNEKGKISYVKLTLIPILILSNLLFMSMQQFVARNFSSKVNAAFLWFTWIVALMQLLGYVVWMRTSLKDQTIDADAMKQAITKPSTLNNFKYGLVLAMLIISSSYAVLNHTVNDIKTSYKLETIIDLKPAANNMIEITLPKEVQALSLAMRIKIPKYVSGGALLKMVGMDTIEVGKLVNKQINNVLMIYQNRWIVDPMNVGIICTVILLLGTILEWIKQKLEAYAFEIQCVITGLTIALVFIIGKRFTPIPWILAAFLMVAELVKVWQYPPFQMLNETVRTWIEKSKHYEKPTH